MKTEKIILLKEDRVVHFAQILLQINYFQILRIKCQLFCVQKNIKEMIPCKKFFKIKMKKITEIVADIEKSDRTHRRIRLVLDKWYIERFLFLISGAINTLCVFFAIAFNSYFFVFIPMLFGAMQILFFALTGSLLP